MERLLKNNVSIKGTESDMRETLALGQYIAFNMIISMRNIWCETHNGKVVFTLYLIR